MKLGALWSFITKASVSRRSQQSLCSFLLALAIASCPSCKKQEPVEPEPAEASPPPSATPNPTPVAIATPAPTPNLAPPGVYFLVTAVSVVTDDGVTGLRPGARVTKRADGRFQADGLVVDLGNDQITNDLLVAAKVAGSDQAVQAMIRKMGQAAPTPTPAYAIATPTPERRVQSQSFSQTAPETISAAPPNALSAPARKVNPGVRSSKIH